MPSAVAKTGWPLSVEMSRPWWKPGSPVNGSLRPPNVPVSQPCAGQIDGVAAASASRRSTSLPDVASRLSRPCSRSRSTPNVSSGDDERRRQHVRRSPRWSARRAAGGPRLHDRRQLLHRPRLRRIERRAGAEIVDDAFERLNLRVSSPVVVAVVAVLDLRARLVRRPQLVDVRASALHCAPRPIRTGKHEHARDHDSHRHED